MKYYMSAIVLCVCAIASFHGLQGAQRGIEEFFTPSWRRSINHHVESSSSDSSEDESDSKAEVDDDETLYCSSAAQCNTATRVLSLHKTKEPIKNHALKADLKQRKKECKLDDTEHDELLEVDTYSAQKLCKKPGAVDKMSKEAQAILKPLLAKKSHMQQDRAKLPANNTSNRRLSHTRANKLRH